MSPNNKIFWIVIFLIASCPADTSDSSSDESFCTLPPYPDVGMYELKPGSKHKPGERVRQGTTLQYSCPNIYYLDGSKEVTCSNGDWGTIPACKREFCTKNGQSAVCMTVATCKAALLEIAKGETPKECSISGTVCCLSAPVPATTPASVRTSATPSTSQATTRSTSNSCIMPLYPNDGTYNLKAGNTNPGHPIPDGYSLFYSCSNGYVLDGDKEIICKNGHWGRIPECKREYCTKNGQKAVCTRVTTCKAALLEIANGETPKECSISGTVCCLSAPLSVAAPAALTTPPTLTTPAIISTPRTTTGYIPPDYEYDYVDNDRKSTHESCAPIPAELTKRKTGRRAWDKCIEYQEKFVYPCERRIALGVSEHRVNRCNRGKEVTQERDDLTAKIETIPYMALIGHGDIPESTVWDCGAVIINEKFVMTSAYCTSSVLYKVTYVRTATSKRTEPLDLFRVYKVARVIKHPKYVSPKIPNNIALLETEIKMFLDRFALPACLPVSSSDVNDRAVGVGYGVFPYRGSSPDHLQKTVLTKFSTEECLKYNGFNREVFDRSGIVCYGNRDEARNICQGNNGGAIHVHSRDVHCMYTVVGVTAYATGCEEIGVPAVYTAVAAYTAWIENIVWPD